MFGVGAQGSTPITLWTSLPEPSLQGKDCGATGLSSWLTPSQGFTSSPWQQLAMDQPNSIQAAPRKSTGQR